MSNIGRAFEDNKAFIAYITCGDPDLDTTRRAVIEAERNGADIVELGIPFSDPTAEGPVIQSASLRALAGGVTTDSIMDMVSELRQSVHIPLVFMTYANVVFSYGVERFVIRCHEIGIDGLILPDVPYEERGEFLDVCDENGIDLISLVAPTSNERIEMIAGDARGFIYVVSSLGVTGTRESIETDLKPILDTIRNCSSLPCAIGFGISTPEQAANMAALSDGVIVGSAIVRIIGEKGVDSPEYVGEYIREMKRAIIL